MTCEDIRDLLPAYALDAADEAEARLVREHVPKCLACRRELAAYRATADALALAVPSAAPSARLRERVLAATGAAPRRRARSFDWLRRWLAPGGMLIRLSPAIALLALVVALGSTYQTARLQAQLERQLAANQRLVAEIGARDRLVALLGPGMVMRELSSTEEAPEAEAYVYYRPDSGSAYLLADHLPPLPDGRVYQLWLIRDGNRSSGGTFHREPDGKGRLAIESSEPFAVYQALGVTIEPAGGSSGPTGPRVLAGTL